MQTIMNPTLPEILKSEGKRIIFVHVGKCAGGSAILSLNSALGNDFAMFEMHVYNSNQIIRDAVYFGPDDFIFLISARDPIERFISAYNWDKHNMYLVRETSNLQLRKWFDEFPSADALARSLSDQDPQKAARALQFSRFGHMGMGQSWYTPLDLIEKLPKGRTYLCETEKFAADIQNFVWAIDPDLRGSAVQVFHDKSNFTTGYAQPNDLFSKTLSQEGRRNLRILLNDDVMALNRLRHTVER